MAIGAETLDPLKLRIRDDVQFLFQDGCVIAQGPTASLQLKSGGIQPAIAWLRNNLDGVRSLSEALAPLPPNTRTVVTRLIGSLYDRDMLLISEVDDAATFDRLAAMYPAQAAYAAHHSRRPLAGLLAFRQTTFRVAGDGVLLRNVATAMAEYGALFVTFLPGDDHSGVAALAAAANARDPERAFRMGDGSGGLRDAPADVFIDAGRRADVALLDTICASTGDETWVGIHPVADRIIVLLRLKAQDPAPCLRGAANLVRAVDAQLDHVAPAAAAIAAHHAVFALFVERCGLDVAPALPALEIDQDVLTIASHRLPAVSTCSVHFRSPRAVPVAAADLTATPSTFPRPDIPDGRSETTALYDRIHRASTRMTNALIGPVRRLGEGLLPQLPFSRSEVAVSLDGGVTEQRISCTALSTREARNQAFLMGIEHWAASRLAAGMGDGAVGAGWSAAEAAYRALAAIDGLDMPAPGRSVPLATDEFPDRTVAHLQELATRIAPGLLDRAVLLRPIGDHAWRAWLPELDPHRSAFGAKPAQAIGNILLIALSRDHDAVPGHHQVARLACDARFADVRACLAAAEYQGYRFERIRGLELADHEDGDEELHLVAVGRRGVS